MFNNNLSSKADYYQLSICGKTAEDFRDFKFETIKGKKLILHGDWEKKGFTPNSIFIKERQKEISEICSLFCSFLFYQYILVEVSYFYVVIVSDKFMLFSFINLPYCI